MDEELNKKLGRKIKELSEGQAEALDEINKMIGSVLRVIGNIYYKNKYEVEDEISEFFVSLIPKSKMFKENKNASGWLVIIFQNQIRTHLKRKKREEEYKKEALEKQIREKDIEEEEYLERHLYVNWLMADLTEEEKALIIEYFWSGYTIIEIAKRRHKSRLVIGRKIKEIKEKMRQRAQQK